MLLNPSIALLPHPCLSSWCCYCFCYFDLLSYVRLLRRPPSFFLIVSQSLSHSQPRSSSHFVRCSGCLYGRWVIGGMGLGLHVVNRREVGHYRLWPLSAHLPFISFGWIASGRRKQGSSPSSCMELPGFNIPPPSVHSLFSQAY